jgi:hypothetical protein
VSKFGSNVEVIVEASVPCTPLITSGDTSSIEINDDTTRHPNKSLFVKGFVMVTAKNRSKTKPNKNSIPKAQKRLEKKENDHKSNHEALMAPKQTKSFWGLQFLLLFPTLSNILCNCYS